MKTFADEYGFNIYSQNNEDGIIEEVLIRIGKKAGYCVEFGGADGTYCSNTANLLVNGGWKGKMIEGEEMLFNQLINNKVLPEDVDCENAFVTPENVNHLVGKCDFLSIDIDGNDYEVWKAYKHKPAVVVIEINSSIPPRIKSFNAHHGCSYNQMVLLGEEKGYFLVAHTGNLIFVDDFYRKYFPEITGDPIENVDEYFKSDWLSDNV